MKKEIECKVVNETATITIPIKHVKVVTWAKASTIESCEEFACLVAINEFELGFSLFKGSDEEQTGSIQDLFNQGQTDLWAVNESGGEILEDHIIHISYIPEEIRISIKEKETFNLIFKDQPKTFSIHISGFKLTCKSRSNIINYQKTTT